MKNLHETGCGYFCQGSSDSAGNRFAAPDAKGSASSGKMERVFGTVKVTVADMSGAEGLHMPRPSNSLRSRLILLRQVEDALLLGEDRIHQRFVLSIYGCLHAG